MVPGREKHANRLDPEPREDGWDGPASLRVVSFMALAAVLSIVVLVFDHFERVNHALLILSSLLLFGAVALLLGLSFATNRARASAAESEAIRSASIEAASYAVITTDAKGVIVDWNRAASGIFGYDRTDAVGRDVFALIIPPGQQEDYRMSLGNFADGTSERGLGEYLEVQLKDSSGRQFPAELSVARTETSPLMFTMFAWSLTNHRLREEENRRLADIVRSSEDSVVSVDLNGHVTSWNRGAENIYGYSESEALTKRLSDLTFTREANRELGSLFRRVLNGISGEMDEERITRNGKTLWAASRAFPIRDVDGEVVGMSLVSRDVSDQHWRAADEEQNAERQHWRRIVAEALEKSDFVLWGQPVYQVGTGELSHHELLIRMIRNGEIVPPGAFLPYVEETDLMSQIDRWVIAHGIDLARTMPVAVNLSGHSVSDPSLGRWIAMKMMESGAEPANLRIEITESAAIENLVEARELVGELSRIGCLISLDDFGTGYGSFTYFKNLPVNEIKIDISFIQDLTRDEASEKVVSSLIALAREFSLVTVAEGIEDEATAVAVRDLGCDLAQGFHLGRPAPIEAVTSS